MGRVRAQFGRVIAARGTWVVCSLLLASMLTGCNKTTSGADSAASATSAPPAASSTSAPPAASSSSPSSPAAGSSASAPATTDKTADVSWTAPTQNTNGSALTDLAGYTIYYGTSPDALTKTVNVASAGATDYVVQGLSQGTWYFAVAAYTNTGLQSSYSTVVSKTIT